MELRLTGRARPPLAAREAAREALEAARSGPAATFAPEALAAADGAWKDALLAWSRQEARLVPLRDYRPVAGQMAATQALAWDATRLGEHRRAGRRAAADAAVRGALALEGHAVALVAATALPRAQRARLQRARLVLREAQALLRGGDVEGALARAERSRGDLEEALGPALAVAERYRSEDHVAAWRRWIEETRDWSRRTGQPAIVVLKEKNALVLLAAGRPVRTYDAEIGRNSLGVKQRQGDLATPEGRYRVVKKKDRGQSRYHRALLLDYPNAADRERFAAAKRRGEIPAGARIGGLIEIHGEGGKGQNWTEGCVALANPDMDELFARVGVGTRVTIVGGDGRDGAFSALLERVDATTGERP